MRRVGQEAEAAEDQSKRQVVRAWFGDEKFWKDVTAQAFAGIIVLFVGFVGALTLGYIKTPSGRYIALWAYIFIVPALILVPGNVVPYPRNPFVKLVMMVAIMTAII